MTKIGYGNPPSSGQFKKGQSGNPKGRPRGQKLQSHLDLADLPTDRVFNEHVYGTVKARTSDGIQELPFPEALIKVMQAEALKGRRLIIKDILIYMRDQERMAARRAQEYSDALEILKAARQAVLDKAKLSHLPPPKVYPHPDDIVLDRQTCRYTLIGPFDESEATIYDTWLSIQRLLMIWSERARRRGACGDDNTQHYLLAVARIINNQLPPSCQWSESKWIEAVMELRSKYKKSILSDEKMTKSRIVESEKDSTNNLSLPQRNITILNVIASSLADVMLSVESRLKGG